MTNIVSTDPERQSSQATVLEKDLSIWHSRMERCMAEDSRIIAFRGAGNANGIEPEAASGMAHALHDYVTDITESGTPVVLMYDGDSDVPERPDLGSVFGALADSLRDNDKVTTMAVQTTKWYKPKNPGAALASSTGNAYETYVFDKDMPDIGESLKDRGLAHSALTQSEALVSYPGYEQVIVGPVGPIAAAQLRDLAGKAVSRPAEAGPVRVTVLASRVNPALDEGLRATVSDPNAESDKRERAGEKLKQRQNNPYGLMFTPSGELALDPSDFPNVDILVRKLT